MDSLVCFVRTDWGETGKGNCECCAINTAGKARAAFSRRGRQLTGAALHWKSSVGCWRVPGHTAPNHSRPASCVIDADIDAEDQVEREPQKGQQGS